MLEKINLIKTVKAWTEMSCRLNFFTDVESKLANSQAGFYQPIFYRPDLTVYAFDLA